MSPFAHWNISECQSGFMPVIPLSRPFSASLAPEKKNGILSNASTPLRSRKQKGYQVAQWNTVIQNNTKRDNDKKNLSSEMQEWTRTLGERSVWTGKQILEAFKMCRIGVEVWIIKKSLAFYFHPSQCFSHLSCQLPGSWDGTLHNILIAV